MNGLQRHALQEKLHDQLIKMHGDDCLNAIKSLVTNIRTLEFSNSMTKATDKLLAINNTYNPYSINSMYSKATQLGYEPPKFGMNDILDCCCNEALSQLAAHYNIDMPDLDGKFASEIQHNERDPWELRFSEREFHAEIVIHSKELFLNEHYVNAVHEACKAYIEALKNKSGSSKDGTDLMSELSLKGGKIKFNTLTTDSERNYQQGLDQISRGVVLAFRNVTAHDTAKSLDMSAIEALDMLSTVSLLLKALDKATISNVGSSH